MLELSSSSEKRNDIKDIRFHLFLRRKGIIVTALGLFMIEAESVRVEAGAKQSVVYQADNEVLDIKTFSPLSQLI